MFVFSILPALGNMSARQRNVDYPLGGIFVLVTGVNGA